MSDVRQVSPTCCICRPAIGPCIGGCARKPTASTTFPAARAAASPLLDWLYAYRRGGFEALKPRPRRDTGQVRALPQAVADQRSRRRGPARISHVRLPPRRPLTAAIARHPADGRLRKSV